MRSIFQLAILTNRYESPIKWKSVYCKCKQAYQVTILAMFHTMNVLLDECFVRINKVGCWMNSYFPEWQNIYKCVKIRIYLISVVVMVPGQAIRVFLSNLTFSFVLGDCYSKIVKENNKKIMKNGFLMLLIKGEWNTYDTMLFVCLAMLVYAFE